MPPKVYAIGSCRIHTPLRRAREQHGLDYGRNTAIEFYHNTAEIRQMAAFLAGMEELLFALSPLLSVIDPLRLFDGTAEDFRYFREADIYVVEISTIKLCRYRDHQLQLVRLRDFLQAQTGMDEALLHRIYTEPELARTIRLPAVAADEQWLAQDILETADFSMQTAAELAAGLCHLHDQLGKPVLYVSHFVNLPDGSAMPQRALIRDVMARVVPELPQAAFLDPTPVTAEGGYAASLIDQGHYAPEMEMWLARILTERIGMLA